MLNGFEVGHRLELVKLVDFETEVWLCFEKLTKMSDRDSEKSKTDRSGCFPDSGAKSPLPVSSSSVAVWAAAAEGHPFEAYPRRPPTGWALTPWRRLTTSGGRVCTTSAFRRSGLETDRDAPRAAAVVEAGAAADTASFQSSAWSRRT